MMSEREEMLFKDDEYCYQMVIDSRKVFTSSKSTMEQIDNIYKMLGIMYLYCNEKLEKVILSTMEEIDRRIILGELWKITGKLK